MKRMLAGPITAIAALGRLAGPVYWGSRPH
jgi:hypothetical protein